MTLRLNQIQSTQRREHLNARRSKAKRSKAQQQNRKEKQKTKKVKETHKKETTTSHPTKTHCTYTFTHAHVDITVTSRTVTIVLAPLFSHLGRERHRYSKFPRWVGISQFYRSQLQVLSNQVVDVFKIECGKIVSFLPC